MSFVIARQPVFDKDGNVYGYEVYLRKSDNLEEYPKDVPYNKATFIMAELVAELGIQKVSEGKSIFINVALDTVLNRSLDLLPAKKVVFDLIKPQVEVGQTLYSTILKRIDELKEKGATFAINEDLYSGKYVDLFQRSYIVEFSVNRLDENRASAVKRNKKLLLVSRIENEEQYQKVKNFGDLFEGYHLGKPQVVKEFELAPFLKTTLMRMIAALNTVQSVREFANIIASDVGMSAKLLRFVNSAYFTKRKEIKDIVQACSYLGMDNLKKFTLLVAANDYVAAENPTLWKKSLIRAMVSEEIAKRKAPSLINEAYLAGLFSLIDQILGVDKVEFLREVNIDEEIIGAFTGENPELANILQYATRIEEALSEGGETFEETVKEVSQELGMSEMELKRIAVDAEVRAEELLRI